MKTAVVAGATGLIGNQLLEMLLESERYGRVVAVTRTALLLQHPRLTNLITDFSKLETALFGFTPDDVFCCLGTTMAKAGSREKFYEVDFRYPVDLAQVTFGLGATQYLLVSALGADKQSRVYYNRVKGEVEEAISQVGFAGVHIFRPSLLLGPRNEKRSGEEAAKVIYKVFSFLVPEKYKAIEAGQVAKAMLAYAARDMRGTFIHESRDMKTV